MKTDQEIAKIKQRLRFASEIEFQSFFAQLSLAEFPDFQAVDGAGGDMGFDGIRGMTAYQVYFPEEKNRMDRKYVSKIDEDLDKILRNKEKLGLKITEWIFVVPEDLRIRPITHLMKKTAESGIKCLYWGATKLTELTSKHPYITDSFPYIFMPSVKNDLNDIKSSLKQLSRPISHANIGIITDGEFHRELGSISKEYQPRIDSIPRRPDGSLYRPDRQDLDYISEMQEKIEELRERKNQSDQTYGLELKDAIEWYDELTEKAEEDFAAKGLYNSGLKYRSIGKLRDQKKREIEKLKLKYGITDVNLLYYKENTI